MNTDLTPLKNDKKMIAQLEANKAMKDPGLDFLMGKIKIHISNKTDNKLVTGLATGAVFW